MKNSQKSAGKTSTPSPETVNRLKPIYDRSEIAPIAAQLLTNDCYQQAVERAIKLLAECDRQRTEAQEFNKSVLDAEPLRAKFDQAQRLDRKQKASLPASERLRLRLGLKWRDMYQLVTKTSRTDRAIEKIVDSMEAKDGGKWTPEKRTHAQKMLEKEAGEACPTGACVGNFDFFVAGIINKTT